MIEGVKRKERVFVGNSVVKKTDKTLNKGEDMVVCLSGTIIKDVTERVEKVLPPGKGRSIIMHVGTHNAERERERERGGRVQLPCVRSTGS